MEALSYLICIAVGSFAVLSQPAVAQGANTTLPLPYRAQVLQGDGSQTCPSETQRGMLRNIVRNDTQNLLRQSVVPLLQVTQRNFCSVSTGWRRVAYLNMSDPTQRCPSAWMEITTPHRVCGTSSAGCAGVMYTTGSEQYDQVCGRIIGFQSGSPDAFYTSSSSIDTYYVDGVSVTRGSPRQHIWTFAAGVDEQTTYTSATCPCVNGSTNQNQIPSFVGQNYFCESGLTHWDGTHVLFPDGDPLWDGQGCGSNSTCCTFNSPPWFNVRLPSSTTDYIEVRICSNIVDDESPIQLLELYVK